MAAVVVPAVGGLGHVVEVPDGGVAAGGAAGAAVAEGEELGEESVEAAAGGLHRDQCPVFGGDEQAAQGGLRRGGRLADEVGAQGGGEEPEAVDEAGFGAVTEEGLDADDEVDLHRRGASVVAWVVAGDPGSQRVGADLPGGAGVAVGAGGRGRCVEGGPDGGEGLQGQDRGEASGAVVEGTGGDVPVGAGLAVAAGFGVGGDGEAGAAYGLAQSEVAEAGESGCEVVVDLRRCSGLRWATSRATVKARSSVSSPRPSAPSVWGRSSRRRRESSTRCSPAWGLARVARATSAPIDIARRGVRLPEVGASSVSAASANPAVTATCAAAPPP